MLKKNRVAIFLSIVVIVGAVVVQSLLNVYFDSVNKQQEENLTKVHSDAVLKAKAGLEVYAVLVSSLKAYLTNRNEFPSEIEYQKYLKDLVTDINFKDSIVVSYLDKNHEFKYVFDVNRIDPIGLKGQNAKDFRPSSEIEKLDNLIHQDGINIFEPINLREGWVGLPFNFSARYSKNETLGYIAPVIDIKYLLDFFYSKSETENFVHSFKVNDTFDVTREAVYDGTKIYNKRRDTEYYKNYDITDNDFIYSKLEVFGLNLTIGSAYKKHPPKYLLIAIITYTWYILLSIFLFLIFYQYEKNKKLNTSLKSAYREIGHKNNVLNKNIFKIQTLIQEVHHRIKNNMQMIGNLLTLQEDEINDPRVTKAFEETKNRIQSMSLVHEKLYGSSTLEDVNAKEYIVQLIQFVEDTVSHSALHIKKTIQVPETFIFDAETMASLGLIINELITNSYKYAFKTEEDNYLEIIMSLENDVFTLIYSDSGPGLPKDFDIETSDSLGLQLISILTDQLRGSVNYSYSPKSAFIITFKYAEKV